MKSFSNILLLFIITLAISCDCEPVNCPEFDREYMSWVDYKKGENIVFASNDDEVNLSIFDKRISGKTQIQGTFILFLGCDSERSDCNESGSIYGTIDSIDTKTSIPFSVEIRNDGYYKDLILYLTVHDFEDEIMIRPKITITKPSRQKLYSSITLNGTNYSDVITMEKDTNIYGGLKVWKTYYSETKGLVAFETAKPYKIYYLKP